MALILLIDDDPLVRESIALQLENGGHEVTTAEHGNAGLKALSLGRFDLVITDIIMPESEGIEFILTARRKGYDQPIIAISGGSGGSKSGGAADYLGFAERLGASAVMQKPFSARHLLENVTLLLTNAAQAKR